VEECTYFWGVNTSWGIDTAKSKDLCIGKIIRLHNQQISTSIHGTPVPYDLWMVPNPDDHLCYGNEMPLSPVESSYQAIQSATPSTPSLGDLSPDPFHVIFPTDEMIMFVMSVEDTPWDDGHHHSILFLEKHTIEGYQRISTPSTIVIISTIPESTHIMFYEGNLSNISPTIPLDISIKPGVVENVHIGASCSHDEVVTYKSLFQEFCDVFAWSYEEILGINPDIVVHEIKKYPGTKPVQQRLSRLKLRNFSKLALFTLWL
jgi:hypothetical protein